MWVGDKVQVSRSFVDIHRMQREGERISMAVITGWDDWIHGELWLLPDGLLRVPSGLLRSLGDGLIQSGGQQLHGRGARRTFGDGDISAVSSRPRAYWIRFDEIDAAALRKGIINGRLRVRTRDGDTRKLLWQRTDGVARRLEPVLREQIGGRLQLR